MEYGICVGGDELMVYRLAGMKLSEFKRMLGVNSIEHVAYNEQTAVQDVPASFDARTQWCVT